jgi:hypothetical protein
MNSIKQSETRSALGGASGCDAARSVGMGNEPSDWMRELRRMHRQVRRRGLKASQVIRRRAGLRAREVRTAWRALRRFGGEVATTSGVSRLRQGARLLRCVVEFGITHDDFYRYRMYRMDLSRALCFWEQTSNDLLQRELYGKLGVDVSLLLDKRKTDRRCQQAGLPIPETVADFEDGQVHWWSVPEIPCRSLFTKQTAGLKGLGARRWDYQQECGAWVDGSGRSFDQDALVRELCDQSRHGGMLLQTNLENHRDLHGLGPSALCTVRLVTIRPPEDPKIEPLIATFRMPAGGSVVDNFDAGGLASPVCMKTGSLGKAVRRALASAHLDLERHPDTGEVIAGCRLPCWPAVVDLALAAHRCFADFPAVGWDIAITADGPVLIEGNHKWAAMVIQQTGCRPLGDTEYPRHMVAWLRAAKVV